MELKPCPFCGSTDVLTEYYYIDSNEDDRFCVTCEICETFGPLQYSESDAIEKWNTRKLEISYELGQSQARKR